MPHGGIALLEQAEIYNGASVSVIDKDTGRRLHTTLPPTFTDHNGIYTSNQPSESIEFQLSVKGTPDEDHELYRKQARLEEFEDGDLGSWKVTVAHDTQDDRWVARATHPDPVRPDIGYHVIECLSTSSSTMIFWSSCRTMIQNADIDFPPVDPAIKSN